jgi:hypothetical protein
LWGLCATVVLGLLDALVLLVTGTQVSQAALPGANGRIAFTLQK